MGRAFLKPDLARINENFDFSFLPFRGGFCLYCLSSVFDFNLPCEQLVSPTPTLRYERLSVALVLTSFRITRLLA